MVYLCWTDLKGLGLNLSGRNVEERLLVSGITAFLSFILSPWKHMSNFFILALSSFSFFVASPPFIRFDFKWFTSMQIQFTIKKKFILGVQNIKKPK